MNHPTTTPAAFPHRACYVNFTEHLQNTWNPKLHYPDAPNQWSEADWRAFFRMLQTFGFNVFEYWLPPTLNVTKLCPLRRFRTQFDNGQSPQSRLTIQSRSNTLSLMTATTRADLQRDYVTARNKRMRLGPHLLALALFAFSTYAASITSDTQPTDRSDKQVVSIVFDGNSWVAGSGSTGGSNFPYQTQLLLQHAGKTVHLKNYGVRGQTIAQMQSDTATQIDPNHTNYDILIGLELVNQWGRSTLTKEEIYNLYKQYFLHRKAAGFSHVYACTPHDQGFYRRTAGGSWATARVYFISMMKSEFPSLGIGVIDCGSDPRLSDWKDTTYFAKDKIHLNNAGQAVQAQCVYDALMSSGSSGNASRVPGRVGSVKTVISSVK
jgi:hypothetical protein